MKKYLLLLLFLSNTGYAGSRHAGEIVELSQSEVPLSIAVPLRVLENALDDPAAFLRKFRPDGAELSKLASTVDPASNNTAVVFDVTVGKGLAALSAHVSGVLSRSRLKCESDSLDRNGFQLVLDLGKSDDLVKDNVAALLIELCPTVKEAKLVAVKIRALMRVGHNYGLFTGPIAARALSQQTKPLFNSFSAVMEEVAAALLPLNPPDAGAIRVGSGAKPCP